MHEYDMFKYWWKSPENQKHESIHRFLDKLETTQAGRTAENLRNMRLYGNYEDNAYSMLSSTYTTAGAQNLNKVTMNVVQSMIDTVVSKIAKNKPKPTFLTDGGNWSLQSKAKNLSKFCEGVFNSSKLYRHAEKAFLDSCIFGTGILKVYKADSEIKVERIFPEEIKIDDSEAIYGKPRQMHQVKFIHKEVLLNMFPKCATAINEESDQAQNSYSAGSNTKDMVRVVESWHLPSGPNAKDGFHVISIKNETLFEEPYAKQSFPFLFVRWTERPLGFFGQGLAEQLQGIQLEINKILRTIQVSMHLVSIPKIFVDTGSKIISSHINNKIGGIIKYQGTPPQNGPLATIPSELFSHLDRLYTRAYEITGISQLSAQSSKPGGLDSGKALREFSDIESERFLSVGKRYEYLFLDAAESIVKLARELYEDLGELKVKVKGRKFLEIIDWKEVDMDEDKYLMDIFPTSSLSNTPSGRLQDVQELLQAGFITPEDGKRLLDFPDLEAYSSLEQSDTDNIMKNIDIMMSKGKYITPEPYQNLQLVVKKTQQAYLKYKVENAPESRLELLRRHMEDANNLLELAEQEQANAQIALQEAQAPVADPTGQPLLPPDPTLPADQVPLPENVDLPPSE